MLAARARGAGGEGGGVENGRVGVVFGCGVHCCRYTVYCVFCGLRLCNLDV